MPFTPAHAVAVAPFRRSPLDISAVVVGCLSPDFEYFLRLAAVGSLGHTVVGLFWFDLPLSLAVLMLWRRYVSSALQALAPGLFPLGRVSALRVPTIARPLKPQAKQFLITCASILVGASTHLLWDSFTHPIFWPYQHVPVLRETLGFGTGLQIPIYKLLQHGSTLVGLIILSVWWARWLHGKNAAGTSYLHPTAWPLLCGAVVMALARVLLPPAFTQHLPSVGVMLSSFVVTCISALWLELVWFGYKLTVAE